MTRRHLADFRQHGRGIHHDRNIQPLRRRPEPIRHAVLDPILVPGVMERQSNAEHSRLLLPGLDHFPAFRLVDGDSPHHGKQIRILGDGFERVFRAVALPGGRDQDGAVDAGCQHPFPEILVADRLRQVSRAAGHPRAFSSRGAPDVQSGVDDEHCRALLALTIFQPRQTRNRPAGLSGCCFRFEQIYLLIAMALSITSRGVARIALLMP